MSLGSWSRKLWRLLPRTPRRIFAHRILTALAPRLGEADAMAFEPDASVIVVGFLTSASGLGQAARLAHEALRLQGRTVLGIDLSKYFFETDNVVDFAFIDAREHRGAAHVLININAPYLRYVLRLLGAKFLKGKRITGYWAWELPSAPMSWRDGVACVHDIAVPSTFVADALHTLGELPAVRVLPHPVAIEAPLSRGERREDASFVVASALNAASGFERKNPLAVIAAFRQAAGADPYWRLRMLVSNAEQYEPGKAALLAAAADDSRIDITFAALDRPSYWRWFGSPDLYVSLHRSEGFGLTLAEAMLARVPVLATHWSGNVDFMSPDNSLPVRYRLVPVVDPQSKYESAMDVWAEADIDHAAELMRRAFLEPEWRGQIAAQARHEALERWARFPL